MDANSPLIYLDNNATTRIAPEVFEAMVPHLTEQYGNPSSAYRFAKAAAEAIKTAREQVAALLHCQPRQIYFTSCGTESNNLAITAALRVSGHRHVVLTEVEHSANIKMGEWLEEQGYGVTWLRVDAHGRLSLEDVAAALREDTAVVSVMWANNETGTLFPVEEIARLCAERKILFHTDAVQAPGKIPLDLSDSPIDFLSLSGHKLHAPKGVGVLYARRGTKLRPYVMGGGQENGKRGGTENVASIVGLGRAAELAAENLVDEQTRVRALRDRLEAGLLERVPGLRVNGDAENRLPNTTNLAFTGVEAEAILLALDRQGICASAGSACTTGALEPSHVLTAMGLSPDLARSCLRFSLSHYTTEAEVDTALEVIPRIVAELKDQSVRPAA
ncbi:MAG: cysteine desulfurase NifS [Verrucomicrobiota bacterium]